MAKNKKRYRERHRELVAEASKRYRARHPARVAEAGKRYREKNRARLLEYHKCYREKHRAQLSERRKGYRENHREQILAYQQRYRETHRELLREQERRRYAGLGEDKRAAINERRRRVRLVKKKRAAEKKRTAEKLKALGPLTLTIPLVRETHPELLREKNRTAEKLKALGPLTLTILLTDCLKSIPVTAYVKAFCDSLDSGDTNVSPPESFVQLLEEDSHTLLVLDSGAVQVVEPPDCDDLSYLLQNISPQEWSELLEDIEESSSFDLEALVPPEDLVHVEDMSPDEGVDLMYDLVS